MRKVSGVPPQTGYKVADKEKEGNEINVHVHILVQAFKVFITCMYMYIVEVRIN